MANEDLIEMAAGRIARCRCRRTDEQCYDCRLFAELAAALREARELNDSRLDDVSTLLGAFNDGLFVRSTHGDSDPRWAIKLFAPLAAMARLQRSVDAAMKPPGGDGSGHE